MLGGFESKPLTHKIQVVQWGFGLGILNGSLFLLRPNEADRSLGDRKAVKADSEDNSSAVRCLHCWLDG